SAHFAFSFTKLTALAVIFTFFILALTWDLAGLPTAESRSHEFETGDMVQHQGRAWIPCLHELGIDTGNRGPLYQHWSTALRLRRQTAFASWDREGVSNDPWQRANKGWPPDRGWRKGSERPHEMNRVRRH